MYSRAKGGHLRVILYEQNPTIHHDMTVTTITRGGLISRMVMVMVGGNIGVCP